ncbi:transposase [Saccharopolyspora hattusasensis]|uniref:transposase n=1 Tax=Saccharopolyspora hattusasensis TaxID=1128679 RepID=UPI003D95D6E8
MLSLPTVGNWLRSLRKYLWGSHFWSPSYIAGSCDGAPLEIVKEYITNHQPETPQLKRCPRRAARRGDRALGIAFLPAVNDRGSCDQFR